MNQGSKRSERSSAAQNSKKTSPRVIVNSYLLLLMTIFFGVLTFCGVSRIVSYFHGHQAFAPNDRPGLCFEEESNFKDGFATEFNGAYVCLTDNDNGEAVRATEINDFVMYIDDQITFSDVTSSLERAIILTTLGSILTLAGLTSTIVYWNHNRGRQF